MSELLSSDPVALIILGIAGLGVVVVVRIFTQANAIREREMWTAIQNIMKDVKEINKDWLATYKEQGDKSNETSQQQSGNIAALTTQIAHLAAAVEKSNAEGANLKGAANLMVDYLKEGNGREGVKHEAKR